MLYHARCYDDKNRNKNAYKYTLVVDVGCVVAVGDTEVAFAVLLLVHKQQAKTNKHIKTKACNSTTANIHGFLYKVLTDQNLNLYNTRPIILCYT